jgi:hypothetical protein
MCGRPGKAIALTVWVRIATTVLFGMLFVFSEKWCDKEVLPSTDIWWFFDAIIALHVTYPTQKERVIITVVGAGYTFTGSFQEQQACVAMKKLASLVHSQSPKNEKLAIPSLENEKGLLENKAEKREIPARRFINITDTLNPDLRVSSVRLLGAHFTGHLEISYQELLTGLVRFFAL